MNNINAKVRHTLIAALELIKKPEHWIKNKYHNKCDGHCAVGAVNKSVAGIRNKKSIRNECIYILNENLGGGPIIVYDDATNVIRFNDAKNTTHKQIVSLFKRSIKNLE